MGRIANPTALGLSLVIYTIAAPANDAAASETRTHIYDELGRLVSTSSTGTVNNSQKHIICYDKAGNRTNYQTDLAGGSTACPIVADPPAATASPSSPPPPPPPPNQPPVPVQDSLTVGICEYGISNVTANDSDSDGHYPLNITAVGSSSKGSADIIGGTAIGFSAYGSPGNTSVTYTVTDSQGASATGTLYITIISGSGCS